MSISGSYGCEKCDARVNTVYWYSAEDEFRLPLRLCESCHRKQMEVEAKKSVGLRTFLENKITAVRPKEG
jgi:hypothetical protein